VKAPFN
jgi:hypothetical protein